MSRIFRVIFVGVGSLLALPEKEEVVWHDFTKGYGLVKARKKPAVIDFYTDWCGWCKVMDKKTFAEKSVQKALRRDYIAIKLNPETSRETIRYDGQEFAPMQFYQSLGGSGFPALAFMDRRGKFVTLLPGFIPPETFVHVLSYVRDECYAGKVAFDDYLKTGKCR